MEFRVLGPVGVLREGSPVQLKPKPLQMLTVLLLTPGHHVSHQVLTRYLWPRDEKPNPGRIRQCFHQLRRSVPEISQENERGSCRIQVDPQSIDLLRFQGFREAARATENVQARCEALRSALAEVRGTPLEDLPGEGFARKRSDLVTDLRELTVSCVQAELDCHEAESALERVESALEYWPDSERLLALNVRALRQLRREDLIAPLLSRWEMRFSRSTTHLLLADTAQGEEVNTRPAGAAPGPFRSKPRQLPAAATDLIGRRAEQRLIEQVVLGNTAGRSRIVVIGGQPGAGKTSLAVRTANVLERHFPDGTLYVDLRGYSLEEPETHWRILARFLNDLGVRPTTPTEDGMVAAYRAALADRAVLLVLDNACDEGHVRHLLPGPGASAAVVTSRRQLHGLAIREGAELVTIQTLDHAESAALLRARLGDDRMGMAAPFVEDVIKHCGGQPLALTIVAARIAEHRPAAIADIVRDLCRESTRLRSLDLGTDNLSVRMVLETTHSRLPQPQAQLLWQLAVHPGPTISHAAVRAIAPDDTVRTGGALEGLIRMHLVDEPVDERYSLHDLIRLYAREMAGRRDENERAAVVDGMLSFLLHNAWSCDRRLDPDRRLPIDEPRRGTVVAPHDSAAAMKWFEAEYPTLTAAVRMARDHGLDRFAWLLPMTMVTFQWRTNRYLDALGQLNHAREAAERAADPADVAMIHRMLAGTHRGLGDRNQAARELRSAVLLSERDGDTFSAALSRHALGVLLRERGAPAEAEEQFRAALAVFEDLGDRLGKGAALCGLGNVRHDLGQYDEGLEYCLRALAVLHGTDDVNGRAHVLYSMGRIRRAKEEHGAAVDDFSAAVDLYRSLAYASREAKALIRLAEALERANRPEESEGALERARLLLQELGERDIAGALERIRRRF